MQYPRERYQQLDRFIAGKMSVKAEEEFCRFLREEADADFIRLAKEKSDLQMIFLYNQDVINKHLQKNGIVSQRPK